jgi:2-polyprenyl-3-methyl-5-hydroxy-6-metoxy-1,4-benzoquinol methylase
MSDGIDAKILRAEYQLNSLLEDCRIDSCENMRLLEIGFKEGVFQKVCRRAGIRAVGLEVVEGYYEKLHEAEPDLELILYDGMEIPLEDSSFDVIVSYQVLEHVGSVDTTIRECVRLLKPGGVMYHVFPNYYSFYEGHYRVFWWPMLNKSSGRVYLKMLGKYTQYYESLNIIKPSAIKKIMAEYGDKVEIISLGEKEFEKRFNKEQIQKVRQPFVRGFLRTIYALPFFGGMFLKLLVALKVYYPLMLVAKKR